MQSLMFNVDDNLPKDEGSFSKIDDAVVLLLCLNFLEKDLYKYKDWKAQIER